MASHSQLGSRNRQPIGESFPWEDGAKPCRKKAARPPNPPDVRERAAPMDFDPQHQHPSQCQHQHPSQ